MHSNTHTHSNTLKRAGTQTHIQTPVHSFILELTHSNAQQHIQTHTYTNTLKYVFGDIRNQTIKFEHTLK